MKKFIFLIFIGTLMQVGCKKTSVPKSETEHKAINGIELIFKQGSNVIGNFIAEDPDGDGGNPPSRIDQITLMSGKVYDVQIVVKNITGSAVNNITEEIKQQGKEHEFFYSPNGINLIIAKIDKDANGFPLGIQSSWSTTSPGTGSVIVKLMHKPLIKGPNDDPSKGHSDVQISFPVKIQ